MSFGSLRGPGGMFRQWTLSEARFSFSVFGTLRGRDKVRTHLARPLLSHCKALQPGPTGLLYKQAGLDPAQAFHKRRGLTLQGGEASVFPLKQ